MNKSKILFRNLFFIVAVISALLLTACGGGGGGGNGGGLSLTINDAMVGTWYLNYEDGKPVVPNSKGEVDKIVLRSDGTCSMTEYTLTTKNHPTYWEVEYSEGTDNGTWGYSDGRLYTTVDGISMNFPVTLDNDSLTITGTYQDSTETWISVYKKTKYSLEK